MHDEIKLPLWARERLERLRDDNTALHFEIKRLQQAHAVTAPGRKWFTIQGPDFSNGEEIRYLYYGIEHRACSLGPGDILLIGRAPDPE